MTAWLVFAVGGAVTFLCRASFLLLGERVRLPHWSQRPLRSVAPAAFAAIAAPATLGAEGLSALAPPSASVLGVIATVIVVGRRRSVPLGLLAGLVTYGLVELVIAS